MTAYETIDYLIDKHGLIHHKDAVYALIDKHILMKTTIIDEDSIPIGQCKMGGSPDLPIGWEIPKYDGKWLEFLVQVNLSEIPIEMQDSPLPKTGMLYFFSAFAWQEADDINSLMEFWAGEQVGCSKVLYFDGDISQLNRHPKLPYPNGFIDPRTIQFEVTPAFHEDYYQVAREKLSLNESDIDKFFDLMIEYRDLIEHRIPQHRLLGYARWIQGRYAPKDMRLLFQLDSEGDDMVWNDSGMFYFMIRPEDLMNRNFSAIYSEFQCY